MTESKPPRRAIGVLGVGAVAAALGVAALKSGLFAPTSPGTEVPDGPVVALTSDPAKACWGAGKEAAHPSPGKVYFGFDFPVDARRALATLHFTAGGVTQAEALAIRVNTLPEGFVEAAPTGTLHRQDLVLRTKHLKPNAQNILVFDPGQTPPGQASWVVCKPWVEVQALPEGPDEELVAQAREAIDKADHLWAARSETLHHRLDAWLEYKQGLLLLNALASPSPRHDELDAQLAAVERELDEECDAYLKSAEQGTEATRTYELALKVFWDARHPCHRELQRRLHAAP